MDAVPEEALACASEGTVRALKVPSAVLVVCSSGPEETAVLLLDSIEDVVDDAVHDTCARGEELGENGDLTLWVGHDGDDVQGLIAVDGVRGILESVQYASNALFAGENFGVTVMDNLAETVRADGVDGLVAEELVATTDEGAGTAVGKELTLEGVDGNNSDRRRAGQMVKKLLEFAELELGAILDPWLLHELVVLLKGNERCQYAHGWGSDQQAHLVQVYYVELLAGDTMEQPTLIVQEDDLQGLKFLGELTGSNVSVDVENLARVGFGETGEDGEGTGPNGSLDGTFVDLCDFAYQTVLVLVEVVGGEHAGGDRTGASAKLFEGGDELEVLVEEDAASNLESLRICRGIIRMSREVREGRAGERDGPVTRIPSM